MPNTLREHTARKAHTCTYCAKRIEPGDRYLECFLFPSEDQWGDGGHIKVHPLCQAFWVEVVGPETDWEGFYEWDEAKVECDWAGWLARREAVGQPSIRRDAHSEAIVLVEAMQPRPLPPGGPPIWLEARETLERMRGLRDTQAPT